MADKFWVVDMASDEVVYSSETLKDVLDHVTSEEYELCDFGVYYVKPLVKVHEGKITEVVEGGKTLGELLKDVKKFS